MCCSYRFSFYLQRSEVKKSTKVLSLFGGKNSPAEPAEKRRTDRGHVIIRLKYLRMWHSFLLSTSTVHSDYAVYLTCEFRAFPCIDSPRHHLVVFPLLDLAHVLEHVHPRVHSEVHIVGSRIVSLQKFPTLLLAISFT